MGNEYDGSVVIAAVIDDTGVKESIASMRSLLDGLLNYAKQISSEVGKAGASAAKEIPKTASEMTSSLATGLLNGKSTVSSAAKSLMNAALSSVKSVGSSFLSVGKSIVSDIVSGVNSASSSLFSTLKSMAESALSAVKGILGIESPSKVMRDEVGKNIGLGVQEGIKDSISSVKEAAEDLGRSVLFSQDEPTPVDFGGVSGNMIRTGTQTAVRTAVQTSGTAQTAAAASAAQNKPTAGNTFIFNKPVETPYEHAREIKSAMEVALYGG